MNKIVDLHTHTTASDGSYSPTSIVELAKKVGVCAIAITDHDTTDGIDEALNAGLKNNIEVVPGVEISVGGTDDMHILGLFIDHKNPTIYQKLEGLKQSRDGRNREMIRKLQNDGFNITYDEVKQLTGAITMGRLHIAQAIEKKGLINDYRKIFKRYIVQGGSAYVAREKLSEKDGIETIIASGGLPFLAHINYLKKSDDEIDAIVKRLMGFGLAGIEAYYSGYTPEFEQLANNIADKYNLLKSGGTDFHGTRRKGVYIGTGRGNMCVPYSLVEKIKQASLQSR